MTKMIYLPENNACKIKTAPPEELSKEDALLERAYKAIHRSTTAAYKSVPTAISFEEHDNETDEIMRTIFGDKKC